MRQFKKFAVLILVLGLCSCTTDDAFDISYFSSNAEEINDLYILMTKHGIDYVKREPEGKMHGFSYHKSDKGRIQELQNMFHRQTAVKYKEPEAREYLQKILTEMNHDFIVTELSDGIWIKWFPDSVQQGSDVTMKVVQYVFEQQASRKAKECLPAVNDRGHR